MLDGIRAAETLRGAELSRATPVAMEGYSGGAHGTAWAAELAASYAPDLHIVGAAEGGTPAELSATAKYLNGTAFFGLNLLATGGLARAFPGVGLRGDLNATGTGAFSSLSTQCVQTGVAGYPFANFDQFTKQPDLVDSPKLQALFTHEKLGQHAPSFPLFRYHVYNDEIVPFTPDRALNDFYCSKSTPVEFVALAGDHISGDPEGFPLVLSFLQSRFSGAAPVDSCSSVQSLPGAPQVPPVSLSGSGQSGSSSSSSSSSSPTVITRPASRVTAARAQLNGTLDSRGTLTYYQFQYGTGRSGYPYGTPVQEISSGASAASAVRAAVTGLRPLAIYHFRLVAFSSSSSASMNEVTGNRQRFTTTGTGRLRLGHTPLTVRADKVAIPLTCASSVTCHGSFSIDSRARLRGGGQATVVCATDDPRSFTIGARRHKTIPQPVRASCLRLLKRARHHRLSARITSSPRSGQHALVSSVVLILR